MRKLKKIVLFFLAIAAVAFVYTRMFKQEKPEEKLVDITDLRQTSWERFSPADKSFSAYFPHTPHTTSDWIIDPQTKQERHYELYIAEDLEKSGYVVTVVSLPKEANLNDRQAIFDSYVNQMLTSAPHNELQSSRNLSVLGRPGREFSISNEKVVIVNQMFLAGDQLYVIAVLGDLKLQNRLKEKLDEFIKNFKLR